MREVRIDLRRYPMYRPLPTNKLPRDVLLSAYQEGVELVWLQSYKKPYDPSFKADYRFLEQNQVPFLTDGRPNGYGMSSFHHAAVDIGDRDLLVTPEGQRNPFSILRAPNS